MKFGIDSLISDQTILSQLKTRRVSLLANPASVTADLTHSVDAIVKAGVKLSSAFGPQHGMRGEKQYNMIESDDYLDPTHKMPVFSLYGKVRRPTSEMMESFDVILVDLQDVGCRIYTFITTLLYLMEEAAKFKKSVWVLDRPNPAGREVEGLRLRSGWESFVGSGPIPMRHGLTIGEMAQWFKKRFQLDVDLKVIKMEGYKPQGAPGFGWPQGERSWVNPSPNAAHLNMARCYAGTVMLEGTHLSEGRGTTRPLEVIGAPDINFAEILEWMNKASPQWLEGCRLRLNYFEPTFYKHAKTLCHGFQIHADGDFYIPNKFKPFRLVALTFKAIREIFPKYQLWRDFPYEYETRLAIDVINGSPLLREWVDNPKASPKDLENLLIADESSWANEREEFLTY